jgi:hypothetical protein
MGTGIETFTSERARRRWSEPPETNQDSLQRAWSAVNKARVVFGLAAAGLFPAAIWWTWVGLAADAQISSGLAVAVSTGVAVIWFVGMGTLFLFWLGRRCGVVERFNCLALCATLAFAMPLVVVIIEIGLSPTEALAGNVSTLLGAAAIGLIFAPLGLFGGWFLWFAIRPAARPLKEIAEVF